MLSINSSTKRMLAFLSLGIFLTGCSNVEDTPVNEISEQEDVVNEESVAIDEVATNEAGDEESEALNIELNVDELNNDGIKVSFQEPQYNKEEKSVKVEFTIFNQGETAVRPEERLLVFNTDGEPIPLGLSAHSIASKDSFTHTIELTDVEQGSALYWNLIGSPDGASTVEPLIQIIH